MADPGQQSQLASKRVPRAPNRLVEESEGAGSSRAPKALGGRKGKGPAAAQGEAAPAPKRRKKLTEEELAERQKNAAGAQEARRVKQRIAMEAKAAKEFAKQAQEVEKQRRVEEEEARRRAKKEEKEEKAAAAAAEKVQKEAAKAAAKAAAAAATEQTRKEAEKAREAAEVQALYDKLPPTEQQAQSDEDFHALCRSSAARAIAVVPEQCGPTQLSRSQLLELLRPFLEPTPGQRELAQSDRWRCALSTAWGCKLTNKEQPALAWQSALASAMPALLAGLVLYHHGDAPQPPATRESLSCAMWQFRKALEPAYLAAQSELLQPAAPAPTAGARKIAAARPTA